MKKFKAEISTSLSTQLIIFPQDSSAPIGAISSFTEHQEHSVIPLQHYDYETGRIYQELIPGKISIMLYAERIYFNSIKLIQNNYILSDPFDIWVISNNKLFTRYKNCLLLSYENKIKVDGYVIIDSATLYCENIESS